MNCKVELIPAGKAAEVPTARFSVGQKCLVLILCDVMFDSRECRSVDATLPVCAPTIPIAEWVGALLYVHLPMANWRAKWQILSLENGMHANVKCSMMSRRGSRAFPSSLHKASIHIAMGQAREEVSGPEWNGNGSRADQPSPTGVQDSMAVFIGLVSELCSCKRVQVI